ncbi:MAG TPA: sigma-54 dependent transcriptional regulator [bacterium]|nr:sigma-54 dependent transcriptional regulator [bacterium]
MTHVLLAEDNADLRASVERSLGRQGFSVNAVGNGLDAVSAAAADDFDLALIDIRLPGRGGIDVLRELKKINPRAAVILMTAYGSLETAVEALRHEAADYLLKPFSLEDLELRVHKVLERYGLSPVQPAEAQDGESSLIGGSSHIRHVRQLLRRIAPTSSPVLILGESGTGKEIAAQEIHRLSPRRERPFVAINCVALAEGVLESELFGHEKGAFTGAIAQKKGLLEIAEGGTVFLDEIGELSPTLQVKLLRFLQEHEIQRVGGTKTIRVKARIIAATNRNLKEEVESKRFREDLLYRLNVFEVLMPPLRERIEDLDTLVDFFTKSFQDRLHKKIRFAPEAMAALKVYPWPGNIRELQNVIERLVALSESEEIDFGDLPQRIIAPLSVPDAHAQASCGKEWLGVIEKEMIVRALEGNRWNQAKAARQLGMKRSTLQYRMLKHDLAPQRKK